METVVLDFLEALLYLAGTFLAYGLAKFINSKRKEVEKEGHKNGLDLKRELTFLAIRFAEQKLREPNSGKDKFQLASEWLGEKFSQLGLDIDAKEIEVLIDSAVLEFNESLKEKTQ
jgi:hypothetical protein